MKVKELTAELKGLLILNTTKPLGREEEKEEEEEEDSDEVEDNEENEADLEEN